MHHYSIFAPSLLPLLPHLFYQPSIHLSLSHSCILTLPQTLSSLLCPPLLGYLKVLSWVLSSSLCTPTLSALSFTHMAFPTTATQMTKSGLFAVLALKSWNKLPIDIRTREDICICRLKKQELAISLLASLLYFYSKKKLTKKEMYMDQRNHQNMPARSCTVCKDLLVEPDNKELQNSE